MDVGQNEINDGDCEDRAGDCDRIHQSGGDLRSYGAQTMTITSSAAQHFLSSKYFSPEKFNNRTNYKVSFNEL